MEVDLVSRMPIPNRSLMDKYLKYYSHSTCNAHFTMYNVWIFIGPNANDTRTRNRYRKPVPVPENLYRFSAGVSCEWLSIFSGTEIWYVVEQCSNRDQNDEY